MLMALVEAADNLSIQVHPDDQMAMRIAKKPFGKNESFFIIEAPEAGYMYNGCKATSREEMAKLIEEGRCMEGVDRLPLKSGDYVYVTGGTLLLVDLFLLRLKKTVMQHIDSMILIALIRMVASVRYRLKTLWLV